MAQIFKNNTTGTLTSELAAGATACTLNAGHTFTDPGSDWYLATLVGVTGTTETSWEIVKVTNVATNTLTITRAQESTADATWPAGTRIEARLTAGATESKANLGAAAYKAVGTGSGDVAAGNRGVTNGDSHDHNGGDGGQIAYSSLYGLPSVGKILQVVAGTSTTEVAVASGTYTDIGLSVTITPRDANSKILLLASFEVYVYESGGGAVGAHSQLLRGSTVVQEKLWSPWAEYESLITTVSYAVLDSPATASATTYKLQGKVSDYVSGMSVSFMDSGSPGSLIALEVAG